MSEGTPLLVAAKKDVEDPYAPLVLPKKMLAQYAEESTEDEEDAKPKTWSECIIAEVK